MTDHNGSEELLNPSGQKQLHVTNFTPTLKTVRHSSNILATRTLAFVASQTTTFTNYSLAQFLTYSLFDFDLNTNIF